MQGPRFAICIQDKDKNGAAVAQAAWIDKALVIAPESALKDIMTTTVKNTSRPAGIGTGRDTNPFSLRQPRDELDALLIKDGVRFGLEIKRADAPRLTPSMRHAMTDLKLDALQVVYPGLHRYKLADRVEVLPFATGMATGMAR